MNYSVTQSFPLLWYFQRLFLHPSLVPFPWSCMYLERRSVFEFLTMCLRLYSTISVLGCTVIFVSLLGLISQGWKYTAFYTHIVIGRIHGRKSSANAPSELNKLEKWAPILVTWSTPLVQLLDYVDLVSRVPDQTVYHPRHCRQACVQMWTLFCLQCTHTHMYGMVFIHLHLTFISLS